MRPFTSCPKGRIDSPRRLGSAFLAVYLRINSPYRAYKGQTLVEHKWGLAKGFLYVTPWDARVLFCPVFNLTTRTSFYELVMTDNKPSCASTPSIAKLAILKSRRHTPCIKRMSRSDLCRHKPWSRYALTHFLRSFHANTDLWDYLALILLPAHIHRNPNICYHISYSFNWIRGLWWASVSFYLF